jgi:hypothetical protein
MPHHRNRHHAPIARFPRRALAAAIALLMLPTGANAASLARGASGSTPAAIQAAVDLFRADLGGANNGVGNSFASGRREINWDGVPDAFAAPNALPNDFFNLNSPRGVVFSSTAIQGVVSNQQPFMVSADADSGTPVRFGNLVGGYATEFTTFSAQRLFSATNSNVVEVAFFIPGTDVPATVHGFGAVFTDVDATSTTIIQYLGVDGRSMGHFAVPTANQGLSFRGVSFDAGERIARVRIYNGNLPARAGNADAGAAADVVVMDDFIYGEPRPVADCMLADGFECEAP